MKGLPYARLLALGLALLAGACAQIPATQAPPPKPAAPQITEDSLRERAKEQLAQGLRQYESGEFEQAHRNLTGALDHGLLSKADQSRARKLIAFIHCLGGREVLCRDEFRKAFEINPEFALTVAEDGHPIWGPVYRNVRTQLIAEREAAQTRRTTSFIPLARAELMLQEGLIKYDAGDYVQAQRILDGALKEGIKEKLDQVRALKHLAFSLCLQDKWRDCRATFVRIYDVDSAFDLTPAEAGHPSWTRTFAQAKAQARKALAAKAAKEAKEKDAPPAAPVPKKN